MKTPLMSGALVRQTAAHTFGATIAEYLGDQQTKLRPRSIAASESYLRTSWRPLHGLALASITRAHVAAELNAIGRRSGPSSANRARSTLSAFFRWAIGEMRCEQNPVIGTNVQEENGSRERSLSDAEVAAVWLHAPENDYGRIVKLLLLTGCRRSEIGDLQWKEVDLAARTIAIPAARTKNHAEYVIPLCDAVMETLQAIPRRDRELVFGSGHGGFSGWGRSKAEFDKLLQFETPWTLHDIRRTVRTGMGTLGVAPHIAEACLNHLPAKLVRVYDRSTYSTEKRAALELWANHLAVAVAKANGANVTTLRQGIRTQ